MSPIPPHFTVLLDALKLCGARPEPLGRLTDSEWEDLLSRWEFVRLTVPLRRLWSDFLPDWVRSRVDRNLADNSRRFERIKTVYSDFADALCESGGDHLVLKGFAQSPGYVENPRFRLQSDIDVYCPTESVLLARDVLSSLGYEPSVALDHQRPDHLPAMVKKTDWQWRGNFYDPDIPLSFEIHFCFWHREAARMDPEGLDQFWLRRTLRRLEDIAFPGLAPADSLGYSALNVLRDLLRGRPSPSQVYELARFLDSNAGNEPFWEAWRELHHHSLRRLEEISFRLAAAWFSCRLPADVQQELDCQPAPVQAWFERFANSPLALWFRPNKDALWLHLALLESSRDKAAVFFERLVPTRVPPVEAPYIQNAAGNNRPRPGRAWRKRARFVGYLASRGARHLALLPATAWHGVRWWWSAKKLGEQFWVYFAASFFFDLGMFIFFFLYNLYLLDCGFKEGFVGLAASASAVGGIVGTIPGGWMAQRFGLRATLVSCFGLVALFSALRVLFVAPMPQLCLSFLAGAFAVIVGVCFAPAMAQMADRQNRAFAFSFVTSTLIGVGVLGGLVGGRLPGWLAGFEPLAAPVHLKRAALLVACGIIALAAWPASRLRFAPLVGPPREKSRRKNPFLVRYLAAMGVWSLVTGAFAPFFNVYFSKYWRMPLEQIGVVYSFSHVSQVLAILFAPAIFRKRGLVSGIVSMQIATAAALGLLAVIPGARGAAVVFVGYMAVQWMSEPGMDTLLMNEVALSERTQASALNILVMSVAGAVAAALAGASFARFGYPLVLGAIGALALVAALLFRALLGKESSSASQPSPVHAPMEISYEDSVPTPPEPAGRSAALPR